MIIMNEYSPFWERLASWGFLWAVARVFDSGRNS